MKPQIIEKNGDGKFLMIQDGYESYVKFSKKSDKVWEYINTFVPPELRGKGIAGKIARFALDYASENNLSIIPTCSYISKFIEKNPTYKFLVYKESW